MFINRTAQLPAERKFIEMKIHFNLTRIKMLTSTGDIKQCFH